MEMKTENSKYIKQECEGILNLEKIEQELQEQDDRFMEMNQYENEQVSLEISNLINIKDEFHSNDDEQVIEWNENEHTSDISQTVPEFESTVLEREVNEDVPVKKHTLSETVCTSEENANCGETSNSAACKKSDHKFGKPTTNNRTKTNDKTTSKNNTTRDEDLLHKCTQCRYVYKKKYNLKAHILKVHTKNKVEKPPSSPCIYKASYEEKLITRLRQNTHKTPFYCKFCRQYFNDKTSHELHMKSLHFGWIEETREVLNCNKCSFTTLDRRAFGRHKLRNPACWDVQC